MMEKNILKELGLEDEFREWMHDKVSVNKYINIKSGEHRLDLLTGRTNKGRILRNLYKENIERNFGNPLVHYTTLQNIDPYRYHRHIQELRSTGLIDKPKRGYYQITSKGVKVMNIINERGVWINPDMLSAKPLPKKQPNPSTCIESVRRYFSPENLIQEGTQKASILHILKARGVMRFSDLATNIENQNLGKYLKRMEAADIVERPAKGIYRLTDKGIEVYRQLIRRGIWRG